MYRYDASYAIEVLARHPGRFGVIKPVDPSDPGVAETVADWAATPGTVGIRIMMNRGVSEDPADPGINRVLAAGARHGLPVNILCWGRLEQARALAARNPDTAIVIDHLGLQQPFEPPPPAQPFADLPDVLKLAAHPNVAIKITGACTLSREAFPFNDIWDPLGRIFDAFGIDRCMWGTDWTRAVGLLTYKQGVDAFRGADRLSDSDKGTLMGSTAARVQVVAEDSVTHAPPPRNTTPFMVSSRAWVCVCPIGRQQLSRALALATMILVPSAFSQKTVTSARVWPPSALRPVMIPRVVKGSPGHSTLVNFTSRRPPR